MGRSLQIAAVTHRGLAKQRNEDSIVVGGWLSASPAGEPAAITYTMPTDQPVVVAICDGLGGHPAGDEASWFAVTEIQNRAQAWRDESGVVRGLLRIAELLAEQGRVSRDRAGMGTTVAGISFMSSQALVFNVGDSPVFAVHDGLLTQLSVLDQPVSRLGYDVRPGVITASLGPQGRAIEPHVLTVPLDAREASTFVICSDGVSDYVALAELESILVKAGSDVARAAADILASTMRAEAPDNVSVVVIRLEPASLESPVFA